MKKISLLILILLAVGCGRRGHQGERGFTGATGAPGVGCSTTTLSACELTPNGGALIVCGETSSILVNGTNGTNGSNGSNGSNGTNGLSAYELWLNAGNTGSFSDYLSSLVGATGANGQNGSNGTNGTNGAQGPQGLQGPAGLPSAFSVVDILNPCGTNGSFDEVFLRLQNGIVLASFSDNSNGNNTRLSLLRTGSYGTTDGYSCSFSIVINGAHGSISWSGGGSSW